MEAGSTLWRCCGPLGRQRSVWHSALSIRTLTVPTKYHPVQESNDETCQAHVSWIPLAPCSSADYQLNQAVLSCNTTRWLRRLELASEPCSGRLWKPWDASCSDGFCHSRTRTRDVVSCSPGRGFLAADCLAACVAPSIMRCSQQVGDAVLIASAARVDGGIESSLQDRARPTRHPGAAVQEGDPPGAPFTWAPRRCQRFCPFRSWAEVAPHLHMIFSLPFLQSST